MTTQNNSKQNIWSTHIDAWQTSNLSQVAYCEHNNLSYSAFGYWRTRLKKLTASNKVTSGNVDFLSVKIKQPEQHRFTLKLDGRHSIEIEEGFDKALLAEIIQAVEGVA